MLQRVQSIWLLLAAAFAATTFKFPFYSGHMITDAATNATTYTDLNATTTIWLSIITGLVGVIAFVNIFLFDNRKLQLKLCYLGIFLTVVLLILYFLEIKQFTQGNIALWVIFYFAILGFYILAARGIWKDEKLIKSLNRLR
ncbi:MAG TPA: DUF4293 domain-containing protein [Flavisolibacter sp.]|nr:DUF4293 domain-containing protein [Flavisolibacter sp.]